MQILPSNTTEESGVLGAYFLAQNTTYDTNASFADMLYEQQEARSAVQNGEAHSVQAALDLSAVAPQVTPLEQAPYNLVTNNGVTYTQEEVLFTKAELEDLVRQLEDNGAEPDSLEELRELAEQPDGASLAQVLYALGDNRTYATLSDEETAALKSLATRIDPTGQLYDDIVYARNNADGEQILQSILSAMDNLPPGQRITLSQSDAALLAKVAGLSDTATQQLLGSFGGYNSIQFNKAELQSFLNPAIHDFAKESGHQDKLTAALDKVLGPLLNAARERMEAEKAASELSNKKVEQSKVVIEETVLKNVNANLENTRVSADNATKESAQDIANEKTLQHMKQELGEESNGNGQNLKEELAGRFGKHVDETASDGKNAKNDAKGDGWNELLSKTDVRQVHSTPTLSNAVTTTPLAGMGMGTMSASALAQNLAAQKMQQNSQTLSQQAAQQVERALFTAASNGTKRIDLQLHPAELGSLTISLTARNGAISALLRTENNDTTQNLQVQMDQVRASLEQQGIRIDKIEVQTQTQDSNSKYEQWDSLQQHNERQEENARREALERMRNLAKMRHNSANSSETQLERNMQLRDLRDSTATNSAQSLHIVT